MIFKTDGVKSFLVVDGDGLRLRFDFPFLKYISIPLHLWSVCAVVPHGTAFIQPHSIMGIVNYA